ncbi:hypothetical protein HGA07_04355 [Nocardia veterana]|uniref:Uncharacterized protein n=1 Tax=Nocardia veterana TaxID=132249 RepID=A0A7X6LUM2_9NOCA|nr:hypothetical protein [Nocardia veterana]
MVDRRLVVGMGSVVGGEDAAVGGAQEIGGQAQPTTGGDPVAWARGGLTAAATRNLRRAERAPERLVRPVK